MGLAFERNLTRRVGAVAISNVDGLGPAEWLELVRSAERSGELLTAADLAERGLAEHPGDVWLAHRAVLALARAGSTEEAARRFDAYGLGDHDEEDVAALRARIAKDIALAASGRERARDAARSAQLYGAIFARTGGYYPGVNAATLSLLAGDAPAARALATDVLERLAASDDESYYAAATEAEAELLLGREDAARAAVARAARLHAGDYGAVATTRRQLRLVCAVVGVDDSLLSALAGPTVAHFCGHRIAAPGTDGRFPAAQEASVALAIAAELDRRPVGIAYGSLASGADILWAEALLQRGSELNVQLPFAREEFERTSVASSGAHWVVRFERCLSAAGSVGYATEDAFLGDDVLYRYGTELSMGLALLRARFLDAEVRQLAVWDGGPALGAAGTAIDVDTWARSGQETMVVRIDGARAPEEPRATVEPSPGRVVRALLFGDLKGFSRLTDEQLPRFAEAVLGAFAAVLARHPDVEVSNTWGDGLFAVLANVESAADCALELQAAMGGLDLEAAGLPPDLSLRLGAHLGPVFPVHDLVRDTRTYMGSHVSRTARIEPVTPPRAVYVTEPFAAALLLAGRDDLACDYVGHMPAAKDYGRLRMYSLRRRGR
jgi:tetratricopeptide (TPR) repeat protein